MRRILTIAALLAAAAMLFARTGTISPVPGDAPRTEKKIIHLKSDDSGPVAPGDSVIFMVGNFAAQHNGAVITCDSAVRYSDSHIECFGNVLINKNTTNIYGDRADYDRDRNTVEIFAPLVKVVDGDATLYAHRFRFNTLDNIGEFGGGGVLTNRENVLEADRGYYYADTKVLVAVDRVEMRNEEYELLGDSVSYELDSDNARFFERTNIWNRDGDYLYGDRGFYSKAEARYTVTRNSYLLTEQQELWCDTLDYFRADEHVVLYGNLQIDEMQHKNLCFGDYGEYWRYPGNAFLTKRPSIVNYDTERNTDSIFMRCDSIYLYTLRRGESVPDEYAARRAALADTLTAAGTPADSLAANAPAGGARPAEAMRPEHGLRTADGRPAIPDSLRARGAARNAEAAAGALSGAARRGAADSLAADSRAVDSLAGSLSGADSLTGADSLAGADSVRLTPAERRALEKQQLREAARKAAAEKKAARAAARRELLDRIAEERQQKKTARLQAQERRDSIAQAKRLARLKAHRRRSRRGPDYTLDSAVVRRLDSLAAIEGELTARTLDRLFDSLAPRPLHPAGADTTAADTIYRFVKGFRHVKIFRSDFQAVCDSITGTSVDSTLHLYIEPVMWNETNQITSEVMDIYTVRQQLHRADFVGSPLMVSEVDTVRYDQIAGKEMAAYFRENEIYLVDVNGNVQTIFYIKDGEPPAPVAVAMIESGDASFYIEEKQLAKIVYRITPVWPIYPLDKIPATASTYLKGFKWEAGRRPTRGEVFDRRIRPSQRQLHARRERPSFPIRQLIDEERRRLTEEGRWADRSEQVDAATVEWMHGLGFEVGQPRASDRRGGEPLGEPDEE